MSTGLIIGGILEDTTYSSRVEAFAPGRRCHGLQTAPLPEPTTGAVAALVNGHPVVCGGARQGRDSMEKKFLSWRGLKIFHNAGPVQWNNLGLTYFIKNYRMFLSPNGPQSSNSTS